LAYTAGPEFDGIDHFFGRFHIAAFHMFLDQAQRTEEKIAEKQDHGYKIQQEGRPEAGGHMTNIARTNRTMARGRRYLMTTL